MKAATLVQFAVERICDQCRNDRRVIEKVKTQPDKFPFPVWVEWPAVGRPDPDCGGKYYRVIEESVQQTEALFGFKRPPGTRRVCEHMGRIIE